MGPFAAGPALVHLALVAEDLGYHSVWFSDHVVVPVAFEPRYPYDPAGRFPVNHEFPWVEAQTAMSFVAGATSRIRIGSTVLIVPYRHPVVLGAQVAALQFLSGGRLILGVGAGWMKEEFDIVGVPHEERGPRLDEALDVIRVMCTTSPAEFHGSFVDLPPSGTLPLPDRPPEIWVGGNTPVALRRAARHDGWHGFQVSPDEVRDARRRLPDRVRVSVRTRLDPDDVAHSAAHVDALREAGADHVVLDVWADLETTEATWRRFAADHLPALA